MKTQLPKNELLFSLTLANYCHVPLIRSKRRSTKFQLDRELVLEILQTRHFSLVFTFLHSFTSSLFRLVFRARTAIGRALYGLYIRRKYSRIFGDCISISLTPNHSVLYFPFDLITKPLDISFNCISISLTHNNSFLYFVFLSRSLTIIASFTFYSIWSRSL